MDTEQGGSRRLFASETALGKSRCSLIACFWDCSCTSLISKGLKQMQCSAHPGALKRGRVLPTHTFLMTDGFPSMQLTENKLIHTSGIHEHNIDEIWQLSHVFKLCTANS